MNRPQILIVEDETVIALEIQHRLQRLGYAVPGIVSSGKEAVLKAGQMRPDLVLMDIKLKGEIDGVQTAGQIRDRFGIPVIYLTAFADEHTLQRAKVTEPFGYLLKPFTETELRITIEMALYKHGMEKKLRDSEEKYRQHLEKLVAARTAELEAANDTLRSEIAERRRAEERLARQAQELARSNAELEQFAYMISHDLREPLRKIKSYTELLEQRYRGQLDARAAKYIAYIVDGAIRMQTLIADLLTYSRVGRGELVLVPTNLEGVLSQVLADLEADIQESKAVVSHAPLPTVAADPLQVAQLLQNLVSNAIKFRGPGRLRVYVSAEQRDGEWIIAVQDNGIGIDPQYSERIFQVFQRLHTPAEYPGTGIGLAICKKIVERHHGRIWFESQPGQGATFYFSIPADEMAMCGQGGR